MKLKIHNLKNAPKCCRPFGKIYTPVAMDRGCRSLVLGGATGADELEALKANTVAVYHIY